MSVIHPFMTATLVYGEFILQQDSARVYSACYFSDVSISRGSVATHLRCGGMFSDCFIAARVFREASTLAEDLKGVIEELEQDQQMSLINVEIVDDELARVYANSNKAQVLCLSVCLSVCLCLWGDHPRGKPGKVWNFILLREIGKSQRNCGLPVICYRICNSHKINTS